MPTPEKYDRENSPNDTSTDEIDKLYPQDGPPSGSAGGGRWPGVKY